MQWSITVDLQLHQGLGLLWFL